MSRSFDGVALCVYYIHWLNVDMRLIEMLKNYLQCSAHVDFNSIAIFPECSQVRTLKLIDSIFVRCCCYTFFFIQSRFMSTVCLRFFYYFIIKLYDVFTYSLHYYDETFIEYVKFYYLKYCAIWYLIRWSSAVRFVEKRTLPQCVVISCSFDDVCHLQNRISIIVESKSVE